MEKGLSQKDLAMQMKEKEHLVKKIENSELIPEDDVRKKLEKVLEIRLIDAPSDEAEKKVQSKLGVRNRAHAAAEAVRQQLIP
jgi:putative transcription factor